MHMFEKYDNPELDNCDCCCDICIQHPKNELSCYSGAEAILNIKGDIIGLAFHQQSLLTLIFNFEGYVKDDFGDIIDADEFLNLNKIKFELLDHKMHKITEAIFDGDVHDGIMVIALAQTATGTLPNGVYYINMQVISDAGTYTLFTPQAAQILVL